MFSGSPLSQVYRLRAQLGVFGVSFFVFVSSSLFRRVFEDVSGSCWGPVGPTCVHFRVIFTSNCGLFLDMALFGKHAFRRDETIVFEVLGGLISVLFL